MNGTPPEAVYAISFSYETVGELYHLSVPSASSDYRRDGVAFLLAQLGHHAAQLFAERIAALELTPPHAGILRAIATNPGRSQQALSKQLGLLPSRVVAYVDELEDRGYVERRRNPADRRPHALYLTESGKQLMQKVSELAKEHERTLTAALNGQQRRTLNELLATLAQHEGLTPGVHPGYRTLGRPRDGAEDGRRRQTV
jgi:DNA-binding MarR family transcriptional regulator